MDDRGECVTCPRCGAAISRALAGRVLGMQSTGGKARMARLTASERRALATKAGKARWEKAMPWRVAPIDEEEES